MKSIKVRASTRSELKDKIAFYQDYGWKLVTVRPARFWEKSDIYQYIAIMRRTEK